jgi:hypothetical protein
MNKKVAGIALVALIGAALIVDWNLSPGRAWLVTMALMVVFLIVLGISIAQHPFGVLINEQNVMSLARFQAVIWTLIVLSAYFVIALARIRHGVEATAPVVATEPVQSAASPAATPAESVRDPLKIRIDEQVLYLMGISAAALVASPLIAATKKSKQPDPKAKETTAEELGKTGNVPDSVAGKSRSEATSEIAKHAQGLLFRNPQMSDASFSDMFEGNEIGNTAHVDLGKVQMFFFTVTVAVAYAVAVAKSIHDGQLYGAEYVFPTLSSGMVALLGISNAGYLANKGVDHTKTAPPG